MFHTKIPKYFFIVGCPRSGTTLLSVLLDRHPNICVTPETNFFNEIAPQLHKPDSPSVPEIFNRWERSNELSIDINKISARYPDEYTGLASGLLIEILDAYTKNKGKQICAEKTPQHLEHVPQILREINDAKILCMLRDGRDVVLSLMSMPWWQNKSIEDTAKLWKHYIRTMEVFQKSYPSQFKTLKYEELIDTPKETLSEVMQFLNLKINKNQFNSNIPSGVVLSRSMEWKGNALNPVNKMLKTHRRNEFSSQDLEFLENFLEIELKRYSYL